MRPDPGQRCLVSFRSRAKPCVDQFTGQVVTVNLPLVRIDGVWWSYAEPNKHCTRLFCGHCFDTLPEDCLQPLPRDPEATDPGEKKVTLPELRPRRQKQFVR